MRLRFQGLRHYSARTSVQSNNRIVDATRVQRRPQKKLHVMSTIYTVTTNPSGTTGSVSDMVRPPSIWLRL